MNISQLPLASVLSDNYMRGEPIPRRTYSTLQVMVVGDGSTDNSPQAIASCRNRIITVLQENCGQTSALNAGFVASSSGDWSYLLQ